MSFQDAKIARLQRLLVSYPICLQWVYKYTLSHVCLSGYQITRFNHGMSSEYDLPGLQHTISCKITIEYKYYTDVCKKQDV